MAPHYEAQVCVHLRPKVFCQFFSDGFKLAAKLAKLTCHHLFWAHSLKVVRQVVPPQFPVSTIVGTHHGHIRALLVVTLGQLQIWDGRSSFHSLFTEHTRLSPQSALSLEVGVNHVAAKCSVATIRTGHFLILTSLCHVFRNSSQFPFPVASHVEVGTEQLKTLNKSVHPYIVEHLESSLRGLATGWTAVLSCLPCFNTSFAEGLATACGLGRIPCEFHTNGTEKVVLKPALKDTFLAGVTTFVSLRLSSTYAQTGKALQILLVGIVLPCTQRVEEPGVPFAGAA